MKPKSRYAITIYSKHTGKDQPLGSTYDSYEAAKEYAERDVCPRCNRYDIYPVGDERLNPAWVNQQKAKQYQREERDIAAKIKHEPRLAAMREELERAKRTMKKPVEPLQTAEQTRLEKLERNERRSKSLRISAARRRWEKTEEGKKRALLRSQSQLAKGKTAHRSP